MAQHPRAGLPLCPEFWRRIRRRYASAVANGFGETSWRDKAAPPYRRHEEFCPAPESLEFPKKCLPKPEFSPESPPTTFEMKPFISLPLAWKTGTRIARRILRTAPNPILQLNPTIPRQL
jgi:hypothetical protein